MAEETWAALTLPEVHSAVDESLSDFSKGRILLQTADALQRRGSSGSASVAERGAMRLLVIRVLTVYVERMPELNGAMPRRNRSPFAVFAERNREAFMGPDTGVVEIAKCLSEAWRALSDEERQPYVDEAAVDLTRFDRECLEFLHLLRQKIGGPPRHRREDSWHREGSHRHAKKRSHHRLQSAQRRHDDRN